MFNSFLSKFKTLFDGEVSVAPDKSNRVVFVANKSVKATKTVVKASPVKIAPPITPPVSPAVAPAVAGVDIQARAAAAAQVIIDNARRIETDAKIKEAEVFQRLKSLDEKERYLIQKEQGIDNKDQLISKKLETIDEIHRKQLEKLEAISGLDVEKAKQLLLSSTEKKMSNWLAKKIDETREELKTRQEELAKEIILDGITHGVTDYVAEYTVSTITLPDEKIKGKIIGREGRNIRSFEKATGVELELDETNDIRISSFDSTRREIARLSLEKLIRDGRIQPVRIETIVAQTKADMDKILINEGKRICQEVGVFNIPIDLIKEVGKFKFRFSYGQNLAKHTVETVKIAVAIAFELKADVNTVRLGALFHDIGKVITDSEGTHVDLGIDLLRRYKISESVINTVAEHHEDKPFSSLESTIVYLGDAASGARPGARYEVHEEYLKRMKNIEEVAKSFPGVLSVAAYQAGREVMVIVEPSTVSDDEATVLSQNIADKLDEEAKWAGQIKVNVIREFRTSATIVSSKISNNAVKNGE